MSESVGGIAPVDAPTINMQKIINIFSQRSAKLFAEEESLEETLVQLQEFWAKPTEKKEEILYQFTPEGQKKFTRLKIPISRAMWAVRKVIVFERLEQYRFEQGLQMQSTIPMINMPIESEPQTKIEVNTAKQDTGIKDKIIGATKKFVKNPESPYNLMLESINYLAKIEPKWHNALHWYYLEVTKRPKINTRPALQNLLENIVIVFNYYIEPNLVMAVHYANELVMKETEAMAMQAISIQQQQQQRNRNQPPQTNF